MVAPAGGAGNWTPGVHTCRVLVVEFPEMKSKQLKIWAVKRKKVGCVFCFILIRFVTGVIFPAPCSVCETNC